MKIFYSQNILFLVSFVLLSTIAISAQQTIVNVPSTDVLDKGKFYFELDSTFKFNNDSALGKFSSFVPRIVAGVGKNIEVGVNLLGNIQPGADATTISPVIKAKIYDKRGWALVAGDHVFIPVRNRGYDIGNYVYAEASKTFETKTRLTFGAFHASKNVFAPRAQRAGGQFGFEQTVNSKFSVGADWITGKHAAGYFTPVVTIKPSSKSAIYLGYSIGNANANHGNSFFYAAVGINLN